MVYDPDKHHRRSIRLKDFDYSQAGAYFVTICTYQRDCLFGELIDCQMRLDNFGEIAFQDWLRLPEHNSDLELDAFVVMPNHLHGILVLTNQAKEPAKRIAIAEIIRRFKSFSARAINIQRKLEGVPVWQRDYYEQIIRNDKMLNAIRQYIENNPAKWSEDNENPNNARLR